MHPDYVVPGSPHRQLPSTIREFFSGEPFRMIHTKHSLWPPDIQSTIESPREILEGQACILRELTRGILTAETRTIHDDCEQRITLCLDMMGPGKGGRHRILTVSHSTERNYPCIVQAEAVLDDPLANSDSELRGLVRLILQSSEVKALASSLVAKARQLGPVRAPVRERRHKGHGRFRPAWVGVDPDEEESNDSLELLCDEPQGID